MLPLDEARALERSGDALSSLAVLRNKAAHFGITPSAPGHAATLAAVQLRAWHALHEFSRTWPEFLRERAEKDWDRAEIALRKLDAFLQTRAEELLPHLKDLQQAGGAVGLCKECTYIGLAREKEEGADFGPTHCRICRTASLAAVAPCPCCRKPLLASLDHDKFELACVTCGYEGDEPEVASVRVSDPPDPREDPYARDNPCCGSCETGERTTRLNVAGRDWFVCSACGEYWSAGWTAVSSCANCGDRWVGVELEFSAFSGCPLCRDSVRERVERM